MITDSYSASFYVENNNGEYSINGDLQVGDNYVEADYSGDSLVKGVNQVIDTLENKFKNSTKPESLEEKVARLESENVKLKAALENSNKAKFSEKANLSDSINIWNENNLYDRLLKNIIGKEL